jgi:amino acid transporter
MKSWREKLLGSPLRSEEEQDECIGAVAGLPVLGLDALASASYGPEAALTILLPLGTLGPTKIAPIALIIVLVLVTVYLSYRQTIEAYPNGGGSFTVAKENLGELAGLVAASALAVDYILNVAVAISAGVGALVSALPALFPFTTELCLGILALLAIINLRGLRAAGLFFMAPTYLFIGCLGTTIVVGAYRTIMAGGTPTAVTTPPVIPGATTAVTVWLLVRAFSSGCTALTGVEAVSNAVPIFRQPSVKLARITLTWIVAILAFLLLGVGFLCRAYHIGATTPGQTGYQSVLSQIVGAVMGRGPIYFLTMTSILMVLALSANTSFADFPRVCRALALDEYLPAEFAHRGSRLVYSAGIIALSVTAGLLLIVFKGITDRLIPLFAIGAFGAFTLSQVGMMMHWQNQGGPHAKRSLFINMAGALATGGTLIVVIVSKFTEGAWMTVLVIPLLIWMFLAIRRYHLKLEVASTTDGPLDVEALAPPIVVIPVKRLDSVTRKSLRLALAISNEIRAVQVLSEAMKTDNLGKLWREQVERPAQATGCIAPKLVVLESAYREFFGPFLKYVKQLSRENPDRTIAVMVPELVERKWYHFLIRHRATLLKGLLLMSGGAQIAIINTPWYYSDFSEYRTAKPRRSWRGLHRVGILKHAAK